MRAAFSQLDPLTILQATIRRNLPVLVYEQQAGFDVSAEMNATMHIPDAVHRQVSYDQLGVGSLIAASFLQPCSTAGCQAHVHLCG